jgi:plastocyanin
MLWTVLGCLMVLALAAAPSGAEAHRLAVSQASSDPGTASRDRVASVEVVAVDFDFAPSSQEPATISVTPGQRVRVTLVNRGATPHNIEFELPSGEVEFERHLPPGARRTLEFVAPEKAGMTITGCAEWKGD